jgi:hypothetical protein
MPVLILVLKMGIIMSYITTTQASFTDDRIFPYTKRNTSVGTCGMIARSVTIVAPIVNEWQAPYPILIMLVFSVIGILTSLTFPDERQVDIKDKQGFQPLAQNDDQSNITFHDVSKDFNISISSKSTKSTRGLASIN